jgi:hypothetical protein
MSSAVTSRASSSPSGSVASRSSVFNDLWKIRRFDQIQDPAESNDCTFSTMLLQPTQRTCIAHSVYRVLIIDAVKLSVPKVR